MYLVQNTVYQDVDPWQPWVKSGWRNRPGQPNDWKNIASIDVQNILNLLQNAQVNISDSDIVARKACWVLDVTTDFKKLYNMLYQPTNVPELGFDLDSAAATISWEGVSADYFIKIWVAQDSFQIIKFEYKLDSTTRVPASGTQGPFTIENIIQVSALFTDYNETGPVVVPPEATSSSTPVGPPNLTLVALPNGSYIGVSGHRTSDTLSFSAVVKNTGGEVAGTSRLTLYLGQQILGSYDVPALNPGEVFNWVSIGYHGGFDIAGTYMFFVHLDTESNIIESNEQDNYWAVQTSISAS
jgi:hypothetical protein